MDVRELEEQAERFAREYWDDRGSGLGFRIETSVTEVTRRDGGGRAVVHWKKTGIPGLTTLAEIGTEIRREKLGKDDREGYIVVYLTEAGEVTEYGFGYTESEADPNATT